MRQSRRKAERVDESKWYKMNPSDVIWWYDTSDQKGERLFSFDKKKVYSLFPDYWKMTPQEREIFNRECPMLATLF